MLEVPRVVDASNDPLAAVLLLGDLADQDVVLIIAGDRDHQIRPRDTGSLQHPQLGRVPVLDRVLEFLLHHAVASVIGFDQRHLAVLADQLPREVPPDLPRARDDHVHGRATSSLPVFTRKAPLPRPGRSPLASDSP